MASSISRQDESIPFMSLATGAAKMELSFPLGTTDYLVTSLVVLLSSHAGNLE